MSELTYAQASVLCRVEGMPIEQLGPYGDWCEVFTHWSKRAIYPDHKYRLTPSASLTPDQAAICLAMGVAVEVHYGNGGKWRPCRIGDCCPSVHGHSTTSLRVPPESEEA